ncbi:MAG TPA: hypothetical protein VE974_23125 [Thermoanaerobaculia bacterium]|nr:hypothetical protein [Thermoanaerobaculia bacterium]
MASTPVQISKLEDSAAGRALQAATNAPLTNFVDFTSTLVTNVFDTLVDNSIKQTRAYADLVASVAGTLEDFEAKTLGDPDQAALDYIRTVILPTYQGTATPALPATFSPTASIAGNTTFVNQAVEQVYGGVTATIGATEQVFALDPNKSIPTSDLFEFTKALLRKQAKRTFEDLRSLVALGVQFIEVSNGTLSTSLTFHTNSIDSNTIDATNTRTDFESRSRAFTGNLSRSVSTGFGGKLAGFYFGRSVTNTIGGTFSNATNSSSLNVNVVNEKNSAVTNLSIDITGSMSLQFQTRHFPPVNNTTTPV